MNEILQASALTFAYAGTPVLKDVSLTLDAGQVVALLGPNGSGKSTLIKCLIGNLHATGTIHWEGRKLSLWRRRELARHIAYLPQSPAFEPDQTVLDVLKLGRSPYWQAFGIESPRDVQVITEVAQLLSLTDLLHRHMDEISGGQRQRVFIGRCLAQEPRAMLLDEPNTFLDLRHQVELGQLLRKLATEKGIAVLMASHDLNLAGMFADRLVLLHNGTIAASGHPDEVLQRDVLSTVYGIPMDRIDRPDRPPLIYPAI